jgi:hypothetical protein
MSPPIYRLSFSRNLRTWILESWNLEVSLHMTPKVQYR